MEKGLFAYCVDVSGERQDVSVGDPSLIHFGKSLPVDEVDLGPSAALLSPEVAAHLSPGAAEPAPAPGGEPEGVEAGEEPADRPSSDGGRRVQLTVRATKDDLHTLNVALAGLRDLLGAAGQMTIDLRVEADSGAEAIDPILLQNMVLQHLEEDQDVRFDHRVE